MKFLASVLAVLMTLSTSAFASPSGMKTCSPASTPLSREDRAIIIQKSSKTNLVDLIAIDQGRVQPIGTLTIDQVKKLKPALRTWAGAGLLTTYIVAGVGSAGVYAFAFGMNAFAPTAAAAFTVKDLAFLAGPEIALGAGLNLIHPLNPFAEFERAHVETCLTRQVSILNQKGESIVVRMKNAKDLKNAVRDLADVVHDLR